ncbi:MAG: ABC1 kinase family protein [Acidimicrobiia bacterium]
MPPEPADLQYGAFSDSPPWLVDPDAATWRRGLAAIRGKARADVPKLTTPPRWPPLGRLVLVVARIGSAVVRWLVVKRTRGPEAARAVISKRLRVAAEALGPTYIKLGQIISAGEGLFPAELVAEFRLLRDRVPPEPFDTVRAVIEADLGRPIDHVFASIDRTPLAAASIAQVHRATLVTGEDVVVKVQRPTVATRVRQDLRALAWLAPHLVGRIPVASLANPPALVELFAETISEELDFRLEAENMLDVARVLVDLKQRGYVIPRPHPTLVTKRVLVMERLSGFAFDDVAGMKAAGVDTAAVIRTGMIAFMEGALIHGIFHGDLHGGNLFVMPDGRTALLDFGITGRLTQPRRMAFLRLMLGATTNDVKTQLAALRDLGALPMDTDLDAVITDLRLDQDPIDPTTLSAEELIGEIQRVVKALIGYGARIPKELMLYVKNLVFLDGAIATLAPDLDLLGEIATVSMHFATAHGERLSRELGIDATSVEVDMAGWKGAFGVDQSTERLTYRELQERRDLIRKRMSERQH